MYVYATNPFVPDFYLDNSNTEFNIIKDYLGSVCLVVNSKTGAIIQTMNHDKFGNVITDTKLGTTPFGFAGRIYDSSTKLVRFGARDYDAFTGRWTAKDPLKLSGGDSNLYRYVANDPVNKIDLNGLFTMQIGFAGNISFGPVAFQGGAGLAFDSQGGFGVYNYTGGSVGAGLGTGGGLSIQFSNASSIQDLSEGFYVGGAYAGAGAGAGVDYFSNGDQSIVGGGLTLGVGAGAAAGMGWTYTNITQLNSPSGTPASNFSECGF